MKWLGKILRGGKSEDKPVESRGEPLHMPDDVLKPADPPPPLKPGERHRVSNKELRQYCTALEQQINFVLQQNNNLGRINVSALNALERIEAIVESLHSTFSMTLIGLFLKPLRIRLFRDLSRIIGQTSRFTIKDEKGNFMVKADHAPDSQLVAKMEQAEKREEVPTTDTI
jgi:hypothetical protein